MQIANITIHNFRSIKEQPFFLKDYSLLIGANNSGKTNLIDAIRIFYEKDLKFDSKRDFPKFAPDDQESWIDIEFYLTEEEFINLKNEYLQPQKTLKVRKYLKSSDSEKVKANQSNIFAYEVDKTSNNLFYGAKNISEAKLGNVIYIPDVATIDEHTKLTGPSAFRNLLEFVVKKVAKGSGEFQRLIESFEGFDEKFKYEVSNEGHSLQGLITDINNEIKEWDTSFDIKINPIRLEEIIKNLVAPSFGDKNLIQQNVDINSFGQGFQRHMIYTLIKLSAKYKDSPAKKDKKEFSPDFTLILFEEPEAFLHPAQQEILNLSLKEISKVASQQVIISSHSTHFVSKNISEIPNILKLAKSGAQTIIYQIDEATLQNTLQENEELKTILGESKEKKGIELESIRYCLYLDPDRSCAFFADFVLICEGLSEKALIDTLINEGKIKLKYSKAYILNAAGKYDIHRYMNLFEKLGINHSILFDRDSTSEKDTKINEFILTCKNKFTSKALSFVGEFEDFLEIPKERDRYKKPLNVMWHYRNGKIEAKKIEELIKIVKNLIDE